MGMKIDEVSKRLSEIGKAASNAGCDLKDVFLLQNKIGKLGYEFNKTKTMKRKKAIRKKKEKVAKLDIDIIDKMNQFIDYNTDLKETKNKFNPFEVIAKTLGYAFEIKMLFQQRKIVASQPIPPKNKKVFKKISDLPLVDFDSSIMYEYPVGEKKYSVIKEPIFVKGSKEYLQTLSNDDISINCNKGIIDKLDSIELRFKE